MTDAPLQSTQPTARPSSSEAPQSAATAANQPVPRIPVLPLSLHRVASGVRLALDQEGLPYVPHSDALITRFVLFDRRRTAPPNLHPEQHLIDIAELEANDQETFAALLDSTSARHQWQLGPYRVSESVARVDKARLRLQLLNRLRQVIEERGGLWLRVSPYPFPFRSAFNLRLDHDAYVPSDFNTVLALLKGRENAATHVVCAGTHQQYPEALARLRGHDVATHGFHHHSYSDPAENLRNIERGLRLLQEFKLDPQGYAAPHGTFSPHLCNALTSCGITHSSEFALCYDDLPFFVPERQLLQIPIHPICLGIFLEAAHRHPIPTLASADVAAEAAADHLCHFARVRYDAGLPIFVYGHPDGRLGRYPRVLRRLFKTIDEFASLWLTNFREINAWWRLRAQIRLTVATDPLGLRIEASGLPVDHRAAVEIRRGDHVALVPITQPATAIAWPDLVFQPRSPVPAFTRFRLDSPHNLKGTMRRLLDWERDTPVDELDRSTWRGLTKWALRRWEER